jgi:hypothetical protein
MMLQEQIRETFGSIRYTIGSGCSGGSIQQHLIAANYPGLLDGILPNCSYEDSWTTAMGVGDCHMLLNYFAKSPTLWASATQRAAVTRTLQRASRGSSRSRRSGTRRGR